jgi:hypothetical protein
MELEFMLAVAALLTGLALLAGLVGRRQPVLASVLLLPSLAGLGTLLGLLAGFVLSVALFGFDLFGRAPWWDRYLYLGGALFGSLLGVAATFYVASRLMRFSDPEYRDQAADYDDKVPHPVRAEDQWSGD